MGRNKRRHANARAKMASDGVQKRGLRQVDRKLSIRVYMTVKQWRQRRANVGIAHLRVVLNETFDHRCNLGIGKALVFL
jgi:hypothetical protein